MRCWLPAAPWSFASAAAGYLPPFTRQKEPLFEADQWAVDPEQDLLSILMPVYPRDLELGYLKNQLRTYALYFNASSVKEFIITTPWCAWVPAVVYGLCHCCEAHSSVACGLLAASLQHEAQRLRAGGCNHCRPAGLHCAALLQHCCIGVGLSLCAAWQQVAGSVAEAQLAYRTLELQAVLAAVSPSHSPSMSACAAALREEEG